MPKESQLTEVEKESIEIEKFIFHIIRQEELQPLYLDEVELSESQRKFFERRFIDIDKGIEYEFEVKEDSDVFNHCQNILIDPDTYFLPLSKRLTSNFKDAFEIGSSDGVFVISVVHVLGNRLLFLLKIDHIKVYSYTIKDKKALMEEIVNNLSEDRKAIQKYAVIDISDFKPWEVLAFDRSQPAGMTKYFKTFLKVRERENNSVLTKSCVTTVNIWARKEEVAKLLPEHRSYYKENAIIYMKRNADLLFDSEEFIDHVVVDDVKERGEQLKNMLRDAMKEREVYGKTFVPKPGSIPSGMAKNKIRSSQEVKIEWEGDAKMKGIDFSDDKKTVTIKSLEPFIEISND